MMDVLTDVLKVLNLSAQTYFCSAFSGPWGIHIPENPKGLFHAVIEGECWLTIKEDEPAIHLTTGDVVAFPTGGKHNIGHKENTQWIPGQDLIEKIQAGNNPFTKGDEENVVLMCGSFEYDTSMQHPFLKDLPCFIHIKSDDTEDQYLKNFLEVLSNESRAPKLGSQVITDGLTEILFVQLIRTYIQQGNHNMQYMSALMHPQIGVALHDIHNDDKATLNVEKLASNMAMSRTTFTDKFTRIVGQSPKRYMINWHMQKARRRLQNSKDPMILIAEGAGYTSEAAFSKAYKQFFGETPGINRINL